MTFGSTSTGEGWTHVLAPADSVLRRAVGGARQKARAPRQQRARAIEPQRFVLEEPRQLFSGGGVERAQAQVLADVLLMLRDRLLPASVGVDRLGVGAQLQRTYSTRFNAAPVLDCDSREAVERAHACAIGAGSLPTPNVTITP